MNYEKQVYLYPNTNSDFFLQTDGYKLNYVKRRSVTDIKHGLSST